MDIRSVPLRIAEEELQKLLPKLRGFSVSDIIGTCRASSARIRADRVRLPWRRTDDEILDVLLGETVPSAGDAYCIPWRCVLDSTSFVMPALAITAFVRDFKVNFGACFFTNDTVIFAIDERRILLYSHDDEFADITTEMR